MATHPIDRHRRARALAGACLLVLPLAPLAGIQADTLLVEAVQSAEANAAERPRRGMSMKSVEVRYGTPVSKAAAVGQPPITRWDYPDYSVYFEYQHVIHSVQKR